LGTTPGCVNRCFIEQVKGALHALAEADEEGEDELADLIGVCGGGSGLVGLHWEQVEELGEEVGSLPKVSHTTQVEKGVAQRSKTCCDRGRVFSACLSQLA
jgi:hypothetical protein